MNEWMSVKDRLPDEDSLVVGAYLYEFTCEPDVAVCNFYNGNFLLNKDGLEASNYDGVATIDMRFNPTHWFPLPINSNPS